MENREREREKGGTMGGKRELVGGRTNLPIGMEPSFKLDGSSISVE